MATFILAAVVLTALAMAAVLVGPRLARGVAPVPRAELEVAVLRQQLAELDAERARGQLGDHEFARAREDLRRRLVDDLAMAPGPARPVAAPRRVLLACALLLPVAAAGLYARLGQPQLLGAPAAAPLLAAEPARLDDDGMLAQLEAHLSSAPGDARAWVMLARGRMMRDRFEPAAAAYARALQASARVARDPLVLCEYADALGMAQGGRLAGRPRELIDLALALDATHPRALEMAGSAAYEAGDFHGAVRYWRQLLARLPGDSAEHTQLAAAVARAEQRAGGGPPS